MRNTDNIYQETLSNFVSSDAFQAIKDLMQELGLEYREASAL